MAQVDAVIEFWFGDVDERGVAPDSAIQQWWTKSDDFDRELEARFEELRVAVRDGEHDDWLDDPRAIVAYIVVLDQFSRNIGRDTPVMYEADEQALAAAKVALDNFYDELGVDFKVAVLMPLMHSEQLDDQELCVEMFAELAEQYPDIERLESNYDYAVKHRDIVADWGRFPHRNEILGRPSTPEEIEFLKMPGSAF